LGLSILFHWSMLIFVPVSYCFYYSSFVVVVYLGIWDYDTSSFILLSQNLWPAYLKVIKGCNLVLWAPVYSSVRWRKSRLICSASSERKSSEPQEPPAYRNVWRLRGQVISVLAGVFCLASFFGRESTCLQQSKFITPVHLTNKHSIPVDTACFLVCNATED